MNPEEFERKWKAIGRKYKRVGIGDTYVYATRYEIIPGGALGMTTLTLWVDSRPLPSYTLSEVTRIE